MQVEGQHDLRQLRLMATGARVSNAYPTIRIHRHSHSKEWVNLDAVYSSHEEEMKCSNTGIRRGCVPLDSRRGKGPPSLRWLGVLRGRSPTLELRTVQTPTGGSSEEYWSMGGSLNQPSSVKEECLTGNKLLFFGSNVSHELGKA